MSNPKGEEGWSDLRIRDPQAWAHFVLRTSRVLGEPATFECSIEDALLLLTPEEREAHFIIHPEHRPTSTPSPEPMNEQPQNTGTTKQLARARAIAAMFVTVNNPLSPAPRAPRVKGPIDDMRIARAQAKRQRKAARRQAEREARYARRDP